MSIFHLHGMVLNSDAPIFLNIIKGLNNIKILPEISQRETFLQGQSGLGLEQHGLVEGVPARDRDVGVR